MSALRHRPLGERIPDLPHAVSCSLPTMADVIGYEERHPAVTSRMTSGYPRFVKHPFLRDVASAVLASLGETDAHFWPCASERGALALQRWMAPRPARIASHDGVHGVVLENNDEAFRHAKTFLQHSGLLLSSREAEDYLVRQGRMRAATPERVQNQNAESTTVGEVSRLTGGPRNAIALCNSGMNAMYAAFRTLDAHQRSRGRTVWVQLGWLYLDTIALLQKFSAHPAADYVFVGDVFDLAGLESLLAARGSTIAGVITEVPTNPLIQTCDLPAVAALCRRHGVALIADPSVNGISNVDVLPHCDVLVTSLTKYFAAEGDVIAGTIVVNPASPLADAVQRGLKTHLEPLYGRDAARLAAQATEVDVVTAKINANTPAVVEALRSHRAVDQVFWALEPRSRDAYLRVAKSAAHVGSMVTFTLKGSLASFYDRLRIAKGPSFGMRTSLACPFLYLAHYDLVTTEPGQQLLRSQGLNPDLIRLSVGTEPANELVEALREALG